MCRVTDAMGCRVTNRTDFSINNDSINDMIICFEFLSFDVFEECKKDEEDYASMLKWCHG